MPILYGWTAGVMINSQLFTNNLIIEGGCHDSKKTIFDDYGGCDIFLCILQFCRSEA